MEECNRSSGAFVGELCENSEALKEGEGENRGEKVGRNCEERRTSGGDGHGDCAVGESSGGDSRASEFETLASVKLSGGADFDESSHNLSGSSAIPQFYLSLCLIVFFFLGVTEQNQSTIAAYAMVFCICVLFACVFMVKMRYELMFRECRILQRFQWSTLCNLYNQLEI